MTELSVLPGSLRRMSRVPVLLVTLVGACALLAACGVTVQSSQPVDASPATSATIAASGPARAPKVDVKSALAALAVLPVKGRAPMTGYDRDAFGPAWSDATDAQWGHNGCDTRNDILRRDLRAVTLKPGSHGCVVLSGTLQDPYGNTTIHFVRGVGTSTAVQIDHVVALADAWQKGAQGWDAEKRKMFANDPRELLAVSGPLNESKRDGDAATWLPPNKAYRCAYVAQQVAVKRAYGLWTTQAEHDAIIRLLEGCSA